MKNILLYTCFLAGFLEIKAQSVSSDIKKKQEAIIEKYITNGAKTTNYTTKEYQEWVDKGLKEDSTIAYLWQQKAMPYWKRRKYIIAQKYFDKAVLYDRERYLSRGMYLKTIFTKDYKSALADFEAYKKEFKTMRYENDHPLELYAAFCYLGLNEFDKALAVFKPCYEELEKQRSEEWLHFLDKFYLGIIYYELGNFKEAIVFFDRSLKLYPTFSDAQYWKGMAMMYLGDKKEGYALMQEGKKNFKKKNTFNEDGTIYELFPYQITWEWNGVE
jgi:tetratricopeptide (TPR) repeat protein